MGIRIRALAPAVVGSLLSLAAGRALANQAATPLGRWMGPNISAPFEAEDYPTLQRNLELVASKPPPGDGYPRWTAFANEGAAAASDQDRVAVKAACKQCHEAYKQSYRKEFKTRAFP
jgi:hypothetical protein